VTGTSLAPGEVRPRRIMIASEKMLFLKSQGLSHKVFVKSFRKSQSSHKSANPSFIIANIKDTVTELCWNELLQSDIRNTFCEIKVVGHQTTEPRSVPHSYTPVTWPQQGVLNLRTTTSHNCEAVPRRARIQGS